MHQYDTGIDHPMVSNNMWLPEQPAEQIHPGIWMSRSNSYAYLVTPSDPSTAEGDLIINTGVAYQGARHRERFEEAIGRTLRVGAIVVTQGHGDHWGGWSVFDEPGAATYAQARFHQIVNDKQMLAPYFSSRRTGRLFARRMLDVDGEAALAGGERNAATIREATIPVLTEAVGDHLSFVVGGRTVELFSVPGGETLDGLLVWLPADRTVFCGNLMGAIQGALPHLSTIRGDRPRSAMLFIESVQRMLNLRPELLITGHGEPVRGGDAIRSLVGKVVDAIRYIHDRTRDGMNAGMSLPELMATIELPAELTPARGRGPVSWYVRAVWEEYAGWFRADSITELYEVPQRDVWSDLVELCGSGPLTAKARGYLAAGRPLQALHLIDIVVGVEPQNRDAREAELRALEMLFNRAGVHYDDTRLLELEIKRARAQLARTVGS